MFSFGKRSEAALATCDPRLVRVMRESLRVCDIDFGVIDGSRSIDRQREYFYAVPQRSKVNPDAYAGNLTKLYSVAKHVTGPGMPHSRACDIIVTGNKTYDTPTLCYIAGVVMTVAKSMGIPMRWGGNWDSDSEVLTDQDLDDCVHFELLCAHDKE